jgi:hypothetical protein
VGGGFERVVSTAFNQAAADERQVGNAVERTMA